MTCDKCGWWRKFFCITACDEMNEEFRRIDNEIIARWEREHLHKETK